MIAHLNNSALIVNLKKVTFSVVLPMLLLFSGKGVAELQWRDADLDWTLKRDRKGIQVFLSKVPRSKFRAVYSTMELEATTSQLAALVMDLDNCPKWASMCKSAKIIERVSDQETYVHSVNKAPFPVRDRDLVARVSWSIDPETGIVSMRSDAVPDKLDKRKGIVRVQYASSEWYFIPQGDGRVLVENYAHVDPNGKVPAWLTNLLIVESPYKTLLNMRKLVRAGNYQNAHVSFISDQIKPVMASKKQVSSKINKDMSNDKMAELSTN